MGDSAPSFCTSTCVLGGYCFALMKFWEEKGVAGLCPSPTPSPSGSQSLALTPTRANHKPTLVPGPNLNPVPFPMLTPTHPCWGSNPKPDPKLGTTSSLPLTSTLRPNLTPTVTPSQFNTDPQLPSATLNPTSSSVQTPSQPGYLTLATTTPNLPCPGPLLTQSTLVGRPAPSPSCL